METPTAETSRAIDKILDSNPMMSIVILNRNGQKAPNKRMEYEMRILKKYLVYSEYKKHSSNVMIEKIHNKICKNQTVIFVLRKGNLSLKVK